MNEDETLPLADSIRDKWDRGDKALLDQRRDYWLNLAFFEGEQWVYFHRHRNEVTEYPRGRKNDRVRATINKIGPNIINGLAKLTKRTLGFEVLASAASDDVIGGARLGETILEASRVDGEWEQVRYEELFNCYIGATSAVCVEWDGTAGEELEVDDDSGAVVGTGEVKLTALSIAEFTLEPGTRNPNDARWWMMAKALPVEQVQEMYHLKTKPSAESGGSASPVHRRLLEERGFPTSVDMATVLTYYERPTPSSKGRCVTVVGEEVVDDRPWPFPFKKLNLRVFRQQKLPMRWTGHTMVTDARPLQVLYNAARSTMQEHMKVAANARLTIPDTSEEYYENLTDEPGEIIKFDGSTGFKPSWLEPPHIDRWIIQEADRLGDELDDIMGIHDISRGEAPGDRNSGLALSVLAEKDETPLGLMAHDQAAGWGDLATMVLQLYAAKVPEQRQARVETESGVPITVEWTGKMLRDQTRASVPLDNVLPTNRAAMQAWVINLATNFPQVAQSLSPTTLARMIDMPGTSMMKDVVDADVAKAARVIHQISAGHFVLPETFDDHAKHIAELNRFRKSVAYEYGTSETRESADLLVMAHQRMGEEEAMAQREANAVLPGLGALPQAHEPPGSMVPPDAEEAPMAVPAGAGTPPAAPAGMP